MRVYVKQCLPYFYFRFYGDSSTESAAVEGKRVFGAQPYEINLFENEFGWKMGNRFTETDSFTKYDDVHIHLP